MMKIRASINKVLEICLIVLMSVLVVDVLWQVTSRYLLGSPSSYTDEIAGYLLIWVGLLGSAYVAGKNEHLAIDLWAQRAKGKIQRNLYVIIYITTALFAFCVMTIGGAWLVYTRFLLEVTSASLELNLGYVYLVLPLSGILILYYSIDNLIQLFKSHKNQ